MCAYQHHERPKRDSSPSAIITRNQRSNPALKHINDQAFGSNAGVNTPNKERAKDRLGRMRDTPTSSGQNSPTNVSRHDPMNGTNSHDRALRKHSRRQHRVHHDHHHYHLKNGLQSPRTQGISQHTNGFIRSHSHQAHHGSPFANPHEQLGRHFLSKTNLSLQNLSSLGKLVDDRTGYHEDKRVSDEELSRIGKQKNGKQLREYYEKLNEILDGWREVDEILDSKFPEEVMLRFGSVEEVERFNGNRKRLPWLEGELDSEGTESGYQEESEESDDDDLHRKNGRSSFARAASALSGWFGGNTGTPPQQKANPYISGRDEEQALLSSSAPGPPTFAQKYGSTSPYRNAGPGLTTINDDNGVEEDGNDESMPSLSGKERAGRMSHSPPNVGTVRSATPSGQTPRALENGAVSSKLNKTNTINGKPRKKLYRRRSQEDSGTASDDEFDEDDEDDGVIQAGKLDAKIAAEHEERQSRAKTREVVIPGTNGETIKADDVERNQSTSTDRERQNKAAQLGGVSERERMRLLQHVPGRQEREGEREKGVQFAININLAVNVLLLAGKAIAVVSSNSVSLIASLVDSALDLLSTVIIFGTSKAISYRSFHTYFKYPVGKKRFEPLGVVIFAVLMIASFCQVLVESVERLFAVMRTGAEAPGEAAELPLIGIAFMVLTIIIKTFMWFIYRKSHSSGVRAVAQDAENDVVFNIASLIFPVVGSKLGWPALDPIGGICLSIYIIAEWLETLTETVTKLSGAVGESQDISRALYLIVRFRSVNSVSALEVYHAGDDMIVEADVVLPHTMALKEAHDAGEVITYGMELLSGIERSYIHLDYNPGGQAGHVTQRG
ncbi:hypothetical protein L7F22_043579 [Adiantum nelumboides]|nr:hypothetical protein [Adiantum nelumboides]